jgi:hypothetical protein
VKTTTLNVIVCAVILFALLGCASQASQTPPPSTQKPLMYPNAQQIRVSSIKDGMPVPASIVDFQTSDSTEQVLQFYKDELLREQWDVGYRDTPNELDAYWRDGCPKYHFRVVVQRKGNEPADVMLKLITELCR